MDGVEVGEYKFEFLYLIEFWVLVGLLVLRGVFGVFGVFGVGNLGVDGEGRIFVLLLLGGALLGGILKEVWVWGV